MNLKNIFMVGALLICAHITLCMERLPASVDYLQQLPADVIRRYVIPLVVHDNTATVAKNKLEYATATHDLPGIAASNILALARTSKKFQALLNEPALMAELFRSFSYTAYALDVYSRLKDKTFSLPVLKMKEIKLWKKEEHAMLKEERVKRGLAIFNDKKMKALFNAFF